MPLNPDRLLQFAIEPLTLRITPRDAMLYALGVGFGTDPVDAGQLRFVFEGSPGGLRTVPTMPNQLSGGAWLIANAPMLGITPSGVMQGEQGFEVHRPLPPDCTVQVATRVTELVDKGAAKGALVLTEATVHDQADGRHYATLRSTVFCRHDGGFGGTAQPAAAALPAVPDHPPDIACDLPTLPQAALIYRLSGDYHPLHADPVFAAKAGFDRPLLHGKCTMAVAGHALLKTCCGYQPERLRAMACRFSAPVFPGETIRTQVWHGAQGHVHFNATVPARGATVLSHGTATVLPTVLP